VSSYELTVLASLDLEEIYDQIAADNSSAALKLINAIEERCSGLAEMPNQGGSRNELFPGMRSVAVGNYIIFYKPSERGILVIRVLHGKRDCDQFFLDGLLPTELGSE
jgi:toxin ParE1/3/4